MLEHQESAATDKVKMQAVSSPDNQQVTPFELGWLIGFIEGEGCVGMYWQKPRHQISPKITVTNTDLTLIEFGHDIINRLGVGSYVYGHNAKKYKEHWKRPFRLHVEGIKRNHKLLGLLLPFWHPHTLKRRSAEMLYQFCCSRMSHPVPAATPGGQTRYTQEEFAMLAEFDKLRARGETQRGILRDHTPSFQRVM